MLEKVLFFDKKQKNEFVDTVKNQLEIKNSLLGLIKNNPNRKTTRPESNKKAFNTNRK